MFVIFLLCTIYLSTFTTLSNNYPSLYCDYIISERQIRFQKTNGGYSAPICAIVDSNVAVSVSRVSGAAAGDRRSATDATSLLDARCLCMLQ